MATNGKKVCLVKLGQKSFGDGRRTFAKHLNWDQLLATKAEIIQNLAVFSFCVQNRRFCNPEFLFLFTCEGNIQCANKVLRLAMEHRVTLQPRYAKNVIRYAFMLKGSQSHVFA